MSPHNLNNEKGLLLLCDDRDMPMNRLELYMYDKVKAELGINPMSLRKEIIYIDKFEEYLQEVLDNNENKFVIACNKFISEDATLDAITKYKNSGGTFYLLSVHGREVMF